jgi:signal transduction histidine kinase
MILSHTLRPRARSSLRPLGLSLGGRGSPRRVAVCCGGVVAASGVTVLCGWMFGIDRLKNLSPGVVSMKPNAAAALLLCGVGLTLCGSDRGASRVPTAIARVCVGVAALIGAVTLLEYATGADVGIDQLLFREPPHAPGTIAPGRMAVMTALGLVLASCSIALIPRRRFPAQQVLAAVLLALASSALLGYLYGTDLTRPWGTNEVSAFTVAVLTLLGLGLLMARPDRGFIGVLLGDSPGGLMARWLLAVAVVVLPVLGVLRLAGQSAGLYSARAGVGIMVLASLVVLVATVALTAIRLNALGNERMMALERLAESDRQLRRALEQLLRVHENERRGLATDLHDDALPALSGIGLQLELARDQCGDADVRARLSQSETQLRATRLRLRHLMLDLIPDALVREGLASALRHRLDQMAKLNGIEYELEDRLSGQPPAGATAVLYRVALEALRNVARHADARLVRVELRDAAGRLDVTVSDDGVGFRPVAARPGHLGLSIMKARAELAGGGIRIDSRPGHGSVIAVWVPVEVQGALEIA